MPSSLQVDYRNDKSRATAATTEMYLQLNFVSFWGFWGAVVAVDPRTQWNRGGIFGGRSADHIPCQNMA